MKFSVLALLAILQPLWGFLVSNNAFGRFSPSLNKGISLKMSSEEGLQAPPPMEEKIGKSAGYTVGSEDSEAGDKELDEVLAEYPGAEDRTERYYTLSPKNEAGKPMVRAMILGGNGKADAIANTVHTVYKNDLVVGAYAVLRSEEDNSEELEELSSTVVICEVHDVDEIVRCAAWLHAQLVVVGEGYDAEFVAGLEAGLRESGGRRRG
ncbi:unnamed protein product [Heterosigma akashiwo]